MTVRKFETLKEVFVWVFSEKEDFNTIKNHYELSDEVESVQGVFIEVGEKELERYLLENSYVEKQGNHYIFEDK